MKIDKKRQASAQKIMEIIAKDLKKKLKPATLKMAIQQVEMAIFVAAHKEEYDLHLRLYGIYACMMTPRDIEKSVKILSFEAHEKLHKKYAEFGGKHIKAIEVFNAVAGLN